MWDMDELGGTLMEVVKWDEFFTDMVKFSSTPGEVPCISK